MTNDFDKLLMSRSRGKEFDVATEDFSLLEVRRNGDQAFHYFFHTVDRCPVSDFILHKGPQVHTICTVTFIFSNDSYSPRFRFWKKDTTKPRKAVDETLPNTSENRQVKASVDTKEGHRNFWKLMNYLQECANVSIPKDRFRAVTGDGDHLVELLKESNKDTLVGVMGKLIGGEVTEADLNLIANRKGQLEIFRQLLTDVDYFDKHKERLNTGVEGVWQRFFDKNSWIFGYGLTLIPCESYDPARLERITTGANVFGGAGKRVDALLRTKGAVSSLLFCEIKKHDTELLAATAYRKPDVYQPSGQLVGAVCQVQKTAEKAIRDIGTFLHKHVDPDGTPGDFEVATIRPRRIVVAGVASEFATPNGLNPEKIASFELYRRSIHDVEIITFDELYQRALFIVEDQHG
ncbi:Shedu immune nuclease family protein [Nocardia mangyaensis]|uniref:Shedu immune nuclease family protein n=1 Tax=Nocardia mangyaensis TaxID=2213200 RepID=UPI0026744532|nr:Shedu immune nuclease family protein [Nocardia mangyaensis]MDO3645691.1 DUF4263 domain-containing protein [Nocardia mangyaensis]